jgi:predicted dehydrogenase
MKTVRFGVIGVVNIGTAHVNCIGSGKIQGAVLTAACDIAENRRAFCEQKWGVPAFERYEDMLTSGLVDAVVVSVPHPLHADIAMAALDAGLHVLVEKPLDITCERAMRIEEARLRTGKRCGVVLQNRFNLNMYPIREAIDSGRIGKRFLRYPEFHPFYPFFFFLRQSGYGQGGAKRK